MVLMFSNVRFRVTAPFQKIQYIISYEVHESTMSLNHCPDPHRSA